MEKIAVIKTDFPQKFGIPRQSGRVNGILGKIVFERKYRRKEAVRGLEGYSHIWLIWGFSEVELADGEWSPTVRPPRLGGNKRVGVFSTRSPYRPNPVGLSSVKLIDIDLKSEDAPVLTVEGADLMDGTPIYDIKPYLPSSDCHPDARGGFADEVNGHCLNVNISPEIEEMIPEEKRKTVKAILEEDPRPSYQNDPERIYGFVYSGLEIKFRVEGKELFVSEILKV